MDRETLVAIRLASAGYCGGDPTQILEQRTDVVLDLLEYVQFQADYESTAMELNKPTP